MFEFITKFDGIITNCDSLVYYSFFITKCDTVYYKLRQVLQSAMIITNCDSRMTIATSLVGWVTINGKGERNNLQLFKSLNFPMSAIGKTA